MSIIYAENSCNKYKIELETMLYGKYFNQMLCIRVNNCTEYPAFEYNSCLKYKILLL